MSSTPFQEHLFICQGKRCAEVSACDTEGVPLTKSVLKERVKTAGLKPKVRVSHSGCLGVCEQAPNVMCYPRGAWYSHVDDAKVEQIWKDVCQQVEDSNEAPN
jgi:(2Fe-2S) ferredoxin